MQNQENGEQLEKGSWQGEGVDECQKITRVRGEEQRQTHAQGTKGGWDACEGERFVLGGESKSGERF